MTDIPSDDFQANCELLLPFVVCASDGGPYEDFSFVAGFRLGQLWEQIDVAHACGASRFYVHAIERASLPQLDLIAMHFGYVVEYEAHDDDDWCIATLIASEEEDVT